MRLAQVLGLFGEEARVADVRRQVAQVAGEGHAGGDGAGMLDGALGLGLTSLGGEQGDFLQGARFGLLALVAVEHVVAVEQGLGQQAVLAVVAIAAGDGDVVQGQHGVAATQALEHAGDAGHQLAPGAVAEGFVLAAADQQHALGLQARQAVQQQGLARLAGQVAALEQRADGAFGGLVDGLGGGAELAAFTHRHDQGCGLDGYSGYAFYNQFHVWGPRMICQLALSWASARQTAPATFAGQRKSCQFELAATLLTTPSCAKVRGQVTGAVNHRIMRALLHGGSPWRTGIGLGCPNRSSGFEPLTTQECLV